MTAPVAVSPVRVAAAEGAAALPYPGDEPPAVTAAADRLFDAAQQLDALRDALSDARNALPGAWRGAAATTGATEVDTVRTALDDGIGRLYQARGALLNAADQLAAVRGDIDVIRSDWCRAEGSVRAADLLLGLAVDPVASAALHEVRREADGRRQLAVAGWAAAVARSDSVAAGCSAALQASVSGPPVYRAGRGVVTADLGGVLGTERMISDDFFRSNLVRATDDGSAWAALGSSAQQFALAAAGELPATGSPASVAAWWNSRSPTEQQAVLHADPQAVGAADGIPADTRNQANLLYLDRRAQTVAAALDAADPTLAGVAWSWSGPTGPSPADEAVGLATGLAVLRHEGEAIARLRSQLQTPRSQPVYLLAVDPVGRGEAVIAIGNPDTADDVATYVPGTGSDLEGLGGDLDRVQAWADGTQELSSSSTAVVAWLGYESPPGLTAAAHDTYADAAAPALVAFQQGLRASHQGQPSRNTVVAHSYGAMVVSAAASGDRSLAADRLVLVGATGMEVGSVVDLHLDEVPPEDMSARVFAIRHENDPIRFTTMVHGDSPYDAAFGTSVTITDPVAVSLDSFAPPDWPLAIGLWAGSELTAHSAYQEPGTAEQQLISSIIAGVPPR